MQEPGDHLADDLRLADARREQADAPADQQDDGDLQEESAKGLVRRSSGRAPRRQYTERVPDPLDLLPHRPPMRLIDAISRPRAGTARVRPARLRPDDFFFDGHFPGEPIVPAVILVEMLAQVGGLAAGARGDAAERPAPPLRLRVAALGPFKFPRPHAGRQARGARARRRHVRGTAQDRGGGHRRRPGRGRGQRDAGILAGPRAVHVLRACATSSEAPAEPVQLRRLVRDLRTEGGGPGRDAVAVGLGVFIGCLPFYGFHLLICVAAASSLLRLNRLKMYVAANISNPLMAPLLILSELQAGALVRRGELHSLTLDAVRHIDPWSFGADLLVGSLDRRRRARDWRSATATWLLTRDRRRRSVLRRARAARFRSLRRDQHRRVGVRAREAARRPDLSDGADGRSAAGADRGGTLWTSGAAPG